MATKLTVRINKVGKYSKGANIGKDFISFYINGKIHSLRVTDAMALMAQTKSYCTVSKLDKTDLYPTGTTDSSSVYPEGHAKANEPIYTANEKLTVAEYWKRRDVAEPMDLFQFNGFLSPMEEQFIAQQVLQSAPLAL